MKLLVLSLYFIVSPLLGQQNEKLVKLGKSFFEWRIQTQPISGDDIPRIERPNGWVPDFSPTKIIEIKKKYEYFRKILNDISAKNFSRTDSVDFLLLRSAIERVNWEFNILKLPNTHPEFYIDQTLGSIFDLLTISSPFTKERAANFLQRLNNIPKTLSDAKLNLTSPYKPFAKISIALLRNINSKLERMAKSLLKTYPAVFSEDLFKKAQIAAEALSDYSDWLNGDLHKMIENKAIGEENYKYFLQNIALVPYSPKELLFMGELEWQRSVSFSHFEMVKNKDLKSTKMFTSADEEIIKAKEDELEIRNFLIKNEILTIPKWAKNYSLAKMPEYLEALADFGELDDFTSPKRLNENSVRYIPPPSENLGYFYKTAARDPRPLIIHEGVPGHYFQLIQSWKNPNYIRRFYFDSNANEGIGFYFEEMMLQLGLFDNIPQTREVIYSFMKLRALRVEVDINLALGNYDIAEAAKVLSTKVPMDLKSASEEATFFALTPGQAITYQIGKIQLVRFLSDSKLMLKDKFVLQDFHDFILKNGNVPISLLRYEYLGVTDEIEKLWN